MNEIDNIFNLLLQYQLVFYLLVVVLIPISVILTLKHFGIFKSKELSFTCKFYNELGMFETIIQNLDNIKWYGKIGLFKYDNFGYRIKQDKILKDRGINYLYYTKGIPEPINPFTDKEGFKGIDGKELLDAIRAKIVEDLNRFVLSKIDQIYLIVSVGIIIIGIINIIFSYNLNNQYDNLIKVLIDRFPQINSKQPFIPPNQPLPP